MTFVELNMECSSENSFERPSRFLLNEMMKTSKVFETPFMKSKSDFEF